MSGNVNGHPRLVALGMSEPEEIIDPAVALMNEVTEETGIVTTNEGRAQALVIVTGGNRRLKGYHRLLYSL